MNTTTTENGRQNSQEKLTENPNGFVAPPVNILETQEGYVLEAEMPGVNKETLEILLEANELTLIGRRREEPRSRVNLVYRESSPKDFQRTFALDPTIDTAKIQAKMENGVLNLWLPKAEGVKPRQIKIS